MMCHWQLETQEGQFSFSSNPEHTGQPRCLTPQIACWHVLACVVAFSYRTFLQLVTLRKFQPRSIAGAEAWKLQFFSRDHSVDSDGCCLASHTCLFILFQNASWPNSTKAVGKIWAYLSWWIWSTTTGARAPRQETGRSSEHGWQPERSFATRMSKASSAGAWVLVAWTFAIFCIFICWLPCHGDTHAFHLASARLDWSASDKMDVSWFYPAWHSNEPNVKTFINLSMLLQISFVRITSRDFPLSFSTSCSSQERERAAASFLILVLYFLAESCSQGLDPMVNVKPLALGRSASDLVGRLETGFIREDLKRFERPMRWQRGVLRTTPGYGPLALNSFDVGAYRKAFGEACLIDVGQSIQSTFDIHSMLILMKHQKKLHLCPFGQTHRPKRQRKQRFSCQLNLRQCCSHIQKWAGLVDATDYVAQLAWWVFLDIYMLKYVTYIYVLAVRLACSLWRQPMRQVINHQALNLEILLIAAGVKKPQAPYTSCWPVDWWTLTHRLGSQTRERDLRCQRPMGPLF